MKSAIMLAFLGCFFGWLALETNIFGLRISKSAIASYAEQIGIVVPLLFDTWVLGREVLQTDKIGLMLILSLQSFQAYSSMIKAKSKEGDKFTSAPKDLEKK